MTIAKVTSQHKRSTENLERTQRFSLGWEEMKAKALDWLKFPPWPSGEGGTQGPGETRQKLGSNGIMSKKKSDMKKRSFCNLARMSDWRITLSRNWQIVKPACTRGSFQLGISGPVREVMAFFPSGFLRRVQKRSQRERSASFRKATKWWDFVCRVCTRLCLHLRLYVFIKLVEGHWGWHFHEWIAN